MCEISRIIDQFFNGDECKKKEVAERMGMTYSTFARKTNPNDEDRHLNVIEIIPYTINTDFSLLDHIEARLGRVAIKMASGNHKITMKTASEIAEQQGKALASMINSLADNKLTQDEKRDLRKKYMSLAQLIHQALEALNE